jgi:hypothetical protein
MILMQEDLVGNLKMLISQWKAQQSDMIPMADVIFPINDILNGLRDAHVFQGHQFIDVLSPYKLVLVDITAMDYAPNLQVDSINGATVVMVVDSNSNRRVVELVDNMRPLAWLQSQVEASVFNVPYKVGFRVYGV